MRAMLSGRAELMAAWWRRLGGRSRVVIAGAAAVCVLAAAVAVAALHGGSGGVSVPGVSAGPGVAGPAGEGQLYRDPAGLFTVRVPKGWTAKVAAGKATFGNSSGSAVETTETVTFSDPARGTAGPRVTVFAAPITTDFERAWYCQGRALEKSSFHGIPAQHGDDGSWVFSTTKAHFQVAYTLPGAQTARATLDVDKTLVTRTIDGFEPMDATALRC